jgi:hypothetical protein
MAPQDGRAMVCYFPMPFSLGARFTLENETGERIMFYYYIDYEVYHESMDGFGRFHAHYRQEKPAHGVDEPTKAMWDDKSEEAGASRPAWWPKTWDRANVTGRENYLLLDAEGHGHYVGCNLSVINLTEQANDWYGEGDDMIFVDDDEWPPSLHGTGTEDYFNTAFCPAVKYDSPYHGITLPGGPNWSGKISLYRFHIEDPIHFQKSVRVTIEHGHANRRSDDYASTAYWYQIEPHKTFPALPGVQDRLPRAE